MSVNLSPRTRDSLEFEGLGALDPRLSISNLSLADSGYEDYENEREPRLFASNTIPGAHRKRAQRRESDLVLQTAKPFRYPSLADGDRFRLIVLYPGTNIEAIKCRLILSSVKRSRYDHICLSYCWETTQRDHAILIRLTTDGSYYKFPVTHNLHNALLSLRKPTANMLLWIDQICINQDHRLERSHQVSIMGDIFTRAREVIVWLGEEDNRSDKLCEYAKKLKRGDDRRSSDLNRILPLRQVQEALNKLLLRPWFSRVWVIPEIALARHVTVQVGKSQMSWDNLVRLIRDMPLPDTTGFDKQTCLLGNRRQRIAVMTQMALDQKSKKAHADITQLLMLVKASEATDVRDKIYAFYGLTHVRTFPDYARSIERLYIEIAEAYVNAIQWDASYSKWQGLTEERRAFQLMSILYSAGALQQRLKLPSWVPDWTYPWHIAPLWCQTAPTVNKSSPKRNRVSLRSEFRAGGDELVKFDLIISHGGSQLAVASVILDEIVSVSDNTPPSSPGKLGTSPTTRQSASQAMTSSVLRYGRSFFETKQGYVGIANPDILPGDVVSIILGGDVPVILRRVDTDVNSDDIVSEPPQYTLMCDCLIDSSLVMSGDFLWTAFDRVEDIIIV